MNGTDSHEFMQAQVNALLGDDLPFLKDALAWVKDVRHLIQDCGGTTPEDLTILGLLARDLLRLAAYGLAPIPVVMTPEPPTETDTVPPPVRATSKPKRPAANSQNGHTHDGAGTVQVRWSLNERLQELGYPEDLDRGTRIRVGHAVVEAYREAHEGKSPVIADSGTGPQAKRVALYETDDVPMVDALIREMLGDPERIATEEET